jgi:hypothetical protein
METKSKFDSGFLLLVVAVCILAILDRDHHSPVSEYRKDGSHALWHADPTNQTVHALEFDPSGKLDLPHGPPSMRTMSGCVVVDSQNWVCPAVTFVGGPNDGAPNPQYGYIQVIDGEFSVSDTKMIEPPIPWYRWKIAQVARNLHISN